MGSLTGAAPGLCSVSSFYHVVRALTHGTYVRAYAWRVRLRMARVCALMHGACAYAWRVPAHLCMARVCALMHGVCAYAWRVRACLRMARVHAITFLDSTH